MVDYVIRYQPAEKTWHVITTEHIGVLFVNGKRVFAFDNPFTSESLEDCIEFCKNERATYEVINVSTTH